MIDKILNPNTKVGDIFPNDVTQAKNIYRDLCKKYHPDTFADDRANDIISALTKLYNNAIKAIEAGTWEKSNFIAIKTTNGVDFKNPVNINPAAMTVGEFMRLSVLNKIDFLDYLRKNYVPKRFDDFGLKNISVEFMNVLTSNTVIMNFIDDFKFMIEHSKWANDDILNYYDNVIFEGGQGLLLDQYNMDYFPNLTPSNTGMKNPATILNALDYKGEVEVCYVTRSYMTRHGVGRFDTECEKKNINPNMIDITNVPNIFQDSLRYGYLDYKELKERILKDVNNNPLKSVVKISLAITHMNEYEIELKDEKIFDNCYISTGYTRASIY